MKLKRLGALGVSLALSLSMTALPAQAAGFNDVPSTFWGYGDITKMADLGYAKGYEDGSFKPNGKMTAAETLLFCARAAGVDTTTQKQIAADRAEEMEEIIPTSMQSWANKEMAVAVEVGVLSLEELSALADGGALAKTITRENICMYLVRAMQLEPLAKSISSYPLSYQDKDSISTALMPYVYVLTNFGIVKGNELGSFDPKGAVTRAQMTTMLSRALSFMEERGIVTELSEYTSYDWAAGTITAVTAAADGSQILTLNSSITGTRSYVVSEAAKIYDDNMLTNATALKSGQYARLNLTSGGNVSEVRLSGILTTESGTVSALDVESGSLTTLSGGQSKKYTIDRFTQIQVGTQTGDRSLLDGEADYAQVTCYVDEMGHLAGAVFTGGTQAMEGIVESVTTTSTGTLLSVNGFDGVVYRYKVPSGIAVTVNGTLGELNTSHAGKYVQLRVGNDDGLPTSIAVDTVSQFYQGPIKRLGTVGTARSVYLTDRHTNKEVSFTVSGSAVITYEGEPITLSQLQSSWFATILVSGGIITQIDAYPSSVTVEGTLSAIQYGTTTVVEVTQSDSTLVSYEMDVSELPTIVRDGKTSSIDQLRTGDDVVLTIRYQAVEKITATSKDADLKGTITKLTMENSGVTLEVKFDDGTTASYLVGEGVSVSQNGSASSIYNLKPGYAVELVTSGGEIVSIAVTSTASSATQLSGTVYTTSTAGSSRTMTVLITDATGRSTLVEVDVRNANLMDLSGNSLSIYNGFQSGDAVLVFGEYDGAKFVANIVIKQK